MTLVTFWHLGQLTTSARELILQSMTTISKALADAIRRSGLSLRAIELQTGVARAQVSRFVNGERSLTLPAVDALAKLLGLELVQTSTPDAQPAPRNRRSKR